SREGLVGHVDDLLVKKSLQNQGSRKKTTTIDAISKSASGEKPPMRKTAYKNSPMAEVQTLNTAGTRKLPPDGKSLCPTSGSYTLLRKALRFTYSSI
ncbi:unnamed protein product, partial [Porites evermanni]